MHQISSRMSAMRSLQSSAKHNRVGGQTEPISVAANASQSRRRVLQGGFAAAVQLAAAGVSQARQEPINKEVDAADSPFIQELLKRSQEKKEEHDKERLTAYYKKNFKDYFEFEGGNARAGSARGISSETQLAIERWLEQNQ